MAQVWPVAWSVGALGSFAGRLERLSTVDEPVELIKLLRRLRNLAPPEVAGRFVFDASVLTEPEGVYVPLPLSPELAALLESPAIPVAPAIVHDVLQDL